MSAEIAALRARVDRLERTLERELAARQGEDRALLAAAEETARQAHPATPDLKPLRQFPMAPPPPPLAPPPVPSLPQFATIEPQSGPRDVSLETRIGSQWFNRIGILAVLVAVAWFLKLAIDNHWIGPLGRVLIGLVAGASLIAWSERFRTHRYVLFSWSLKAVGSGILYLSLWAGFSLYHLFPAPIAFGAMIVVTAFNGYLAWAQDAELLALYAIVGGLSTPALISTGENHEVALFAYLLLLDLAVLALVALRPWSRLLSGAFLGTVIYVSLWAGVFYSTNAFGITAFFLAFFFLLFALAPKLVALPPDQHHSPWDYLATVVLPLANAALGFLSFYLLLDNAGDQAAEPWTAVAFAAFFLALPRLRRPGPPRAGVRVLDSLHLTAAVVFLTIAIPLKAHGRWLTVGWLVEGAALMWAADRVRSVLLRTLATLCVLLGLVALVVQNPSASTTPIFNERFATYCVGIAACAVIAWIAAHAPRSPEDRFAVLAWPPIAVGAALAVNALILLAIGWEIHSFWWYLQYRGDWHLEHDYRMYAQFTYSALFMAFGALLLTLGFWRRSAFLRWQALILLAATIAKVFTVDLSQLSQGYRILSFLGLGALLLATSFVYQRDWLHLRETESAQE
ncbi:MAG TPA: DUF2339 domain-containing protein [Acidobacteriaceae bacterium]|nr:DUF2339 domain-containing protein [Acidobacteriaceae bacterium]